LPISSLAVSRISASLLDPTSIVLAIPWGSVKRRWESFAPDQNSPSRRRGICVSRVRSGTMSQGLSAGNGPTKPALEAGRNASAHRRFSGSRKILARSGAIRDNREFSIAALLKSHLLQS
jgi:hypothetical protein